MAEFPKWLVIIGVTLIAIGLLWQVGGKFLPLGKLPGDFIFRGENTTVYFPIVTSIIISVVLSLVLFLIGRFR
ncbi:MULTISPECIES: DUF2905 domain-containing protein [Geomicrobium]|uniref:DUF2905 domain-containing protein n=1 Tax=Geomicrobium sediminis TaxID=1347788 RepID=A0ABS2PEV7_9BACL|nr:MULTISPECIES: DUF2905 domain-containing protein [Geomicrobium]EZH67983.1 hypothetical protein DH09_08705 [Bacillaceae bacterium JMAK1]MBM7633930.1 hypothetical protein [Geomicrobium sediminis]GAJ99009.1 hypothetical protein JCM19055_1987 [Geomicrobium sp. JCM 19055]GAK06341.1 hypothetical protein JCM19038_34 [Geomicrobium sp. JCM 19038]